MFYLLNNGSKDFVFSQETIDAEHISILPAPEKAQLKNGNITDYPSFVPLESALPAQKFFCINLIALMLRNCYQHFSAR